MIQYNRKPGVEEDKWRVRAAGGGIAKSDFNCSLAGTRRPQCGPAGTGAAGKCTLPYRRGEFPATAIVTRVSSAAAGKAAGMAAGEDSRSDDPCRRLGTRGRVSLPLGN